MLSPYMTEPGLLASLRGQQYIVLRPTAAVADFYESAQGEILTLLPDGAPHPNTGISRQAASGSPSPRTLRLRAP